MTNSFDFQYQCLLRKIIQHGEWCSTRGLDYKYVFNHSLSVDLRSDFPALTLRNVYPHGAIDEAKNDLSGSGFRLANLKSKGLAKAWEPFGNKFGYIPNTYGRSMRRWPASVQKWSDKLLGKVSSVEVDQFTNAIEKLIKDPTSRSVVIQIHNPTSIEGQPTCQTSFVLSSNGDRLDGVVFCRSNDASKGLLGDFIRYAVFIKIIAYFSKLEPGTLAFNCVNAHIYKEDMEDAKKLAWSAYQPSARPSFSLLTVNPKTYDFEYDLDYDYDRSFRLSNKGIEVGDLSSYNLD